MTLARIAGVYYAPKARLMSSWQCLGSALERPTDWRAELKTSQMHSSSGLHAASLAGNLLRLYIAPRSTSIATVSARLEV